jgi:hypothetical protein
MGQLSPVAQFISTAILDKNARLELHAALLNAGGSPFGLKLSECASSAPLVTLMNAGEHRGAGSGRALCRMLAARGGVTLWMNPAWLRQWDGSTLPIVAAIDNPAIALPRTFKGYIGAKHAIDLPADGSVGGPVLVVLGAGKTHTRRAVRSK